MSVAGMNRMGDQCAVYRAIETTVNGALDRDWTTSNPVLDVRMRLLPITDEIARQVFGAESHAEVQAVVPIDWDIRPKDGIGVTTGDYTNRRFIVEGRRPLGRYAELALVATEEWFPNPPDTPPVGVEPEESFA